MCVLQKECVQDIIDKILIQVQNAGSITYDLGKGDKMSVTQQEKDELRREILEDDYRDSLIEANMYSDLNFAIEQFDLYEAMEAVEEIAKKA